MKKIILYILTFYILASCQNRGTQSEMGKITNNKNTLQMIQGKWIMENSNLSITITNTNWHGTDSVGDFTSEYEGFVLIGDGFNLSPNSKVNNNGKFIELVDIEGPIAFSWEIDEIESNHILVTHSPSMNQFRLIRIE